MISRLHKVIYLILFFSFSMFFACQEENKVPPSKLELRDTLIYEKGSDKPFTGREYAQIENKIIEYDVVNGIKHGEFKLYYESGKMEIKGQLVNNLNEGKWQYFYESGQIESEGDFADNLPEGIWKWYYRSGKIREEGLFRKGIRFGIWKEFDETGKIINKRDYSLSDSSGTESDILQKFKNRK